MTPKELQRKLNEERQSLYYYQRKLRHANGKVTIQKLIERIKMHRRKVAQLHDQMNGYKKLDEASNGY